MLAIGKGLIHPLTALKMRKEGLTNIVWPESLANSEAHSDLLFWRVERVVEIHMYICFLLRCLVLNPWYHSEWDGIQQAWLVTFSYFLVGCVRDFETIFWTSEVKMVGVRACGDLVGNCETWKDQCLSGHNMGWKGVFFHWLPESGQHWWELEYHSTGINITPGQSKFIQGPRSINWQNFRCVLILMFKNRM